MVVLNQGDHLVPVNFNMQCHLFIQAAAGSVQKPDGVWVGVVAGGGKFSGTEQYNNAVQTYDPIENKW